MPSYTITVENNNSVSDYDNVSKNTKLTKLNQNTKVSVNCKAQESKNILPETKKSKKLTSKSNKQRPVSINEYEINKNSRYIINHALPIENDNGIVIL